MELVQALPGIQPPFSPLPPARVLTRTDIILCPTSSIVLMTTQPDIAPPKNFTTISHKHWQSSSYQRLSQTRLLFLPENQGSVIPRYFLSHGFLQSLAGFFSPTNLSLSRWFLKWTSLPLGSLAHRSKCHLYTSHPHIALCS